MPSTQVAIYLKFEECMHGYTEESGRFYDEPTTALCQDSA